MEKTVDDQKEFEDATGGNENREYILCDMLDLNLKIDTEIIGILKERRKNKGITSEERLNE